MSDDFCIIHGYDHMRTQFGNPIPWCVACEEQRGPAITTRSMDRLRYAFRNVDDEDWDYILMMLLNNVRILKIPQNMIWLEVMREARAALEQEQRKESR